MNNTTQNKLADLFAKRFEDYNTKVLEELAKVIKQFNGLTYTQASKLANELKYDKSYIDLVDELSKLTGKSKKEIKKVLEETVKQHTEFADTFFKARNMKTPVYENDTYLKELVNSVANVSEGDFVNLAKSTGFAFLDKKNHIQFLNMKDTYYKVIDECVYAISEGKATYGESIRKIIKQLSDSGVRRIVYANDGKKQYTQRIDTAVRRNVLDSIREVSIESQKEFGKRFDADGVEITVHENPAPDHENVQGHQFRNEEFDKFQNNEDCEDVNGVKFPAISDETGRDRRSIGQYNCYHTTFSIIVGVSKPLYSEEELQKIKERANEKINIDGKEYTRYETTQLQRGLETEIRYAKDRHMMYKEINDREGMLDEQLRINQLTRKYKEISNKAGIREQLNRASVSGYSALKNKVFDFSLNREQIKKLPNGIVNYNLEIGKKYFYSKANKSMNDYVEHSGNIWQRARNNEELKKQLENEVKRMRELKINSKISFKTYMGIESENDLEDIVLSTSLQEQTANLYNKFYNNKGYVVEIEVPIDAEIISTYSSVKRGEKYKHFGEQAEIILLLDDYKLVEIGNKKYKLVKKIGD